MTDEDLFSAALALPAAERAAFLDQACAGEASVRARVEALLASHDAAEKFFASPVTAVSPVRFEEQAGTRIGHYKLLEKIGEGGCGVVWMAEQEKPVRRRVALKVIKLGMDTKEVIARFEAERQALALMDHPNIAKVFDAGTTDAGRPFFVMELVRGIPITRYCDGANLPTEQRLQLFIQVCHAIQHAHQKGIIHRDIKPSNLLVTMHDDLAVPKVIDFGIAKATQGRLTDSTVFTAFAQFIGTPAYMSPEQAEFSGLDVDTRSDIYSLGVLLYELLTGHPPFDPKKLAADGLDEVRRIIREVEPPRPSTRLTALADAERDTLARQRSIAPAQLAAAASGDLDWIVMKALEKNRARRYETAGAFAQDIQRHLKNEPVIARPPSTAYLLQKLIRRHRFGFAAAVAIAAVLLVGGSVSRWQAVRAKQAEQVALKAQQSAVQSEREQSRLRAAAEVHELAARRRAYAADMNLAQQSLANENLGRTREMLQRQRPGAGESDLRGWEWRYLWQQSRSEASAIIGRHDRPIAGLSVSADGRWLASVHSAGSTFLWLTSLATGSAEPLFDRESVAQAVFSPREPILAVATGSAGPGFGPSRSAPSLLRLWQVGERRLIREWRLPGACDGLYFSADGSRVLTVVRGESLDFTWWRVADGLPLATHSLPRTAHDAVVSPGFDLAASVQNANTVVVSDLQSGRELWRAVVAAESISTLAFSADGRSLATAGGNYETDIRLWDATTGAPQGRLEGHQSYVRALLFWPDGKTLVSAGADQTIRVWDMAERRLLRTLRGHTLEVWSLALHADQRTLVSGSKDGAIFTWDLRVPRPRHQWRLPGPVLLHRLADDGQSVLTLNPAGQLVRWSGRDFDRPETLLDVGALDERATTALAPDTPLLAVVSRPPAVVVRIWNWEKQSLVGEIALGETARAQSIAFLPHSTRLLIASTETLQEWDHASRTLVQSWPVPRTAGGRGARLIVAREAGLALLRTAPGPDESAGAAILINLKTRETRAFALGEEQSQGPAATSGEFSPDGRWFAAPNTIGAVSITASETMQRVKTFAGFTLGTHSTFFSPDGRRLAVGSGGNEAVRLFDTDGWEPVLTLAAAGSRFSRGSFSADGSVLAALSFDRALHLWRAPSWAEIEVTEKAAAQSR